MPSDIDLAAGLMVFRIIHDPETGSHLEYLLLQMQAENRRHNWGPPKGYAKPGESGINAALRETEEETRLKATDLMVIPDFKAELNYIAWNRRKQVSYWPAKLLNPDTPITISHEHHQYQWLRFPDAVELVFGRDMKVELQNCNSFLTHFLRNELQM